MKSTGVLIPLDPNNVDFNALYDVLKAEEIGGAILDVRRMYTKTCITIYNLFFDTTFIYCFMKILYIIFCPLR